MIARQSFPSVLLIVISIAYFIVALVPLCAPATLWGLSHLYYLGWPARIAVLLGSLLIAGVTIAAGAKPGMTARATRTLTYFIVPAALLVCFYLLRVKTHYLGDGILRAHELEQGIKLLPTEPLGQFLNYLVYSLCASLLGWSALQSTAALSLLSGIAFYFGVLHLVTTLFNRREDRVPAFIVLYFSGTTLLFCGYVESYSLFPALIAMYAASSIRALESRGSALVPPGLFLLLVLFHFQFLYLAPNLAYLAYRQIKQGNMAIAATAVVTLVIAITAAATSSLWTGRSTLGIAAFMISLTPGDDYWLLSAQHLLDILNQLLLTAIAPIALLVALALFGRGQKTSPQPRLLFAGLLLSGAFAFLSLLQPALGYASDWDLFSSAGIAIAVFALTLYSAREDFSLRRTVQVTLAGAAVFSFLSFAAVNSDADLALARQVDILSIAGEHGAVGFETLGTDLSLRGRKDLAEQMWKRSLAIRPHARVLGNLGQLCLLQKRFDEAESYLKQSMALDSTRAIVFHDLGLTYAAQGRDSIGERYLRKAVELAPSEAKFHNNLAVFLSQHGTLAEAESYSRIAVALQPDNANYATTLATFLATQGNTVEAKEYLLQAMTAQPDFANAYINLAAIYRSEGEIDKARLLLNDYLARFPNAPESAKVRQALEDNP